MIQNYSDLKITLLLILILFKPVQAQLSDTLIYQSRNQHLGSVLNMFTEPDHRVYTLNSTTNIRYYDLVDSVYVFSGEILGTEYSRDMAMGPDGTIFIAQGTNGVSAFANSGENYGFLAHVEEEDGNSNDIVFIQDSLILVANGLDGIRAYHFDGSSFTSLAHIQDGNGQGFANEVFYHSDSTIFLANGQDGLRAYTYGDSGFINVAHKRDGANNDDAVSVVANSNNQVFLANEGDGLRVYDFDGNVFNGISHIDNSDYVRSVSLYDDETLFLTSSGIVLSYEVLPDTVIHEASWSTDGSINKIIVNQDQSIFGVSSSSVARLAFGDSAFIELNQIFDGGSAYDVEIGPDGTIFLANAWGGLHAYHYNESSLVHIAGMYDCGSATDIEIGLDGTIYLPMGDSIQTYILNDSTFVKTASFQTSSYGYPGIRALSTSNGMLAALGDYSIVLFDSSFTIFANLSLLPPIDNANGITLNQDTTLFVTTDGNGLHAFSYFNHNYIPAGNTLEGSRPQATHIGENGTVFVANRVDGVYAFQYLENQFHFMDSSEVSSGREMAVDITQGSNGLLYSANYLGGLNVYNYLDSTLTQVAHGESTGKARAIAVNSEGVVFLAESQYGLKVFTQEQNLTVFPDNPSLPIDLTLYQNYPNPFNPSTTIHFSVATSLSLQVSIFDCRGRKLRVLANGIYHPGLYQLKWNGRDESGQPLSSGIYFCRISSDNLQKTMKMVYLR